jgi:demethylmenaquinone methyltransferase/2-methoxy-6-polyprenyl-1,4-benzoquinol methylase
MSFDHFGIISGLYNRMPAFSPPARMLNLLGLEPHMSLLDAGGGTGRVADSLRQYVKKIVVDDISHPMLRYAVEKGLSTTRAPVERLPFASEIFDRIIMVDALHHVYNSQTAIDELWRVLNPTGVLLIIEPDIRKLSVKMIAVAEKLLLMRSHFLDRERIEELFLERSLTIQVIEEGVDIWMKINK